MNLKNGLRDALPFRVGREQVMTLKELKYIVAIAEENSISRASERLYVSQPYLSQCLMRIERQHDMPLFKRTQNGLVLTFAGEQYVETARKIVKLYNDFETGLCEISNMRKGRLTIGSTIHLGSIAFSTILPIFRELYPNIEIRIREGPSQKIEEYIMASKVDIGLLHCPLKDEAISCVPICENNFVAVLPKDSLLREHFYEKKESTFPFIDPRRFAGEKFVLAYPYQRVRQISDQILATAGIKPAAYLETSSVQTAMCLSSVGLGISFMPENYIALFNCPVEPQFCRMEEEFGAKWTMAVAYDSRDALSGPAKEFIRIMKANMG